MATTSVRMAGPVQLGTGAATLYTCPGATTAVIRRIRVSNPDSSAHTFTLSIGANGAATQLYAGVSVNPHDGVDIWGPFTLTATEIVQALSNVATTLVITIDGTQTT